MPSFEIILLIFSGLFIISILVSKTGSRFGVPVLLVFLAIGMLFGSDGAGLEFRNFSIAQGIGTFALCIILFSGGLDTKIQDIKPVIKKGIVLATIGVFFTAAITGLFIWFVVDRFLPEFNLSFLESFLLASIMSSTDSASVFAVLRSKGIVLKNNLRPLLELESGSNDPMAYMLTVTLISFITSESHISGISVFINLMVQLIIGGAFGFILGKLAVRMLNKVDLNNDSLYPVLLLATSILIFSVTSLSKGNGFLAVYIGGLVVGNSRFVSKRTSIRFFDAFAWLSQIAMFLTLGLLVNPNELLPVAVPAIFIGLFMILFGRPISVFISLLPFRMSKNDSLFLSWVGLRGAVPIVFAILPLSAHVANGALMFNIVFFITLMSLLIQGSSISFVAEKLDLTDQNATNSKLKNFDLEMGEEIDSTLYELTVNAQYLEKGTRLFEMELPPDTLVVMVKRGKQYIVPRGNTEILIGDIMLMMKNNI